MWALSIFRLLLLPRKEGDVVGKKNKAFANANFRISSPTRFAVACLPCQNSRCTTIAALGTRRYAKSSKGGRGFFFLSSSSSSCLAEKEVLWPYPHRPIKFTASFPPLSQRRSGGGTIGQRRTGRRRRRGKSRRTASLVVSAKGKKLINSRRGNEKCI